MKEFIWISDCSMHARPAGMTVSIASKFKSDISIETENNTANAKGLFSLMGLGVKKGDKIKLIINGEDESDAETSLSEFLIKEKLAKPVSEGCLSETRYIPSSQV